MRGAKICNRGRPRWEWEKSGIISVCDLRGFNDAKKNSVVKTISKMIKEFKLPLRAEGASAEVEREIKSIIEKYPREGTVDDERCLSDLNEKRDASQKFAQALVVIIDKNKYKPLENWEKDKGIYGKGHDDGLVFLRYTCEEAVRHEIGHMFGLGHHDERNPNPTCIMNWECPSTQFCGVCKDELEDIWEEELKGKH